MGVRPGPTISSPNRNPHCFPRLKAALPYGFPIASRGFQPRAPSTSSNIKAQSSVSDKGMMSLSFFPSRMSPPK